MTRFSRIALCAALFGLAACGSLGGDQGGDSNLPNRGIVPYDHAVDEETEDNLYALRSTEDEVFVSSSAVVIDERVHLVVEVRDADGVSRFARTSTTDGLELDPLETILSTGDVPSAEGINAPSIADIDGALHLVFGVDSGDQIWHAVYDQGWNETQGPELILSAESDVDGARVSAPNLVATDEGVVLYYEAVADTEDATPTIVRASGGSDFSFSTRQVVLEAGVGCLDTDGVSETDCFDVDGVGQPEVRVAESATGRTIYRLFYSGYDGTRTGIGFASSFDGIDWQRYEFNPVIDEGGRAEQPTNVRQGDRYLLFYYLRARSAVDSGILPTFNEGGQPSESF